MPFLFSNLRILVEVIKITGKTTVLESNLYWRTLFLQRLPIWVPSAWITSLHRLDNRRCKRNVWQKPRGGYLGQFNTTTAKKVCNTEKNKQTYCTQEIIKVFNLLPHLVSFVLFTFLLLALGERNILTFEKLCCIILHPNLS